MMDHDRALPASRSSAGPAAIAVSPKHLFPQTAEVFLILPFERVAGGAHAQGENLPSAATTVQPQHLDPRREEYGGRRHVLPLSFLLELGSPHLTSKIVR